MIEHVKNIQSKPKHIRQQYLWGYLIVIMVIVCVIWALNLSHRFNKKVVEQTKEDIKPFQLFGNVIKNVFESGTASVGNVKTDLKKEEVPERIDKVIPLIPVNN